MTAIPSLVIARGAAPRQSSPLDCFAVLAMTKEV